MKIYTIIESVDVDVISVRNVLDNQYRAHEMFESLVDQNMTDEIAPENWGNNNPSTLIRFAGDDAYAVELHVTEV